MGTNQSELSFRFPGIESRKRLRELILYIADRCAPDPSFGAVKLNKILYFADFRSFAVRGKPVTGVAYMRQKNGPVPKALVPVRNEMSESGELFVKQESFGVRYEQHRVIALRDADLELFTGADIAIVDAIIRDTWGKTAAEVSEESHNIAWKLVDKGEGIPYEAALLSDEPLTDGDISRSHELVKKYGWAV